MLRCVRSYRLRKGFPAHIYKSALSLKCGNINTKNEVTQSMYTNSFFKRFNHTRAISLRPYQQECIDACMNTINKNIRKIAVSMPTGGGKTVVFTQLLSKVKPLGSRRNNTLILAHRRELVEQAANQVKRAYPDLKVEIEMSQFHASGNADVTIASVPSISRPKRLEKFNKNDFKLIIIDEAHHAVSESYMSILDHFGAFEKDSDLITIGFSATLQRADGLRLGRIFDYIAYHKDVVDMIDDQWLCDVKFTTVRTGAKLNEVPETSLRSGGEKDFAVGALSKVMNTPEINLLLFRTWLSMRKKHDFKSTIIFAVDVNHVVSLTKLFMSKNIGAQYVTGTTKPTERKKIVDDFKDGKIPVLINCGVFTEGTDIPGIDCLILARPTKSRTLLVQMLGRGLRLHPNKEFCYVVDFVGSQNLGVISVPTLAGLDPDKILKNKTLVEMRQIIKDKPELERKMSKPNLNNNDIILTTFDSLVDLLNGSYINNFMVPIHESQLAWVPIHRGKFILSKQGSYLKLEFNEEEGTFELIDYAKISSSKLEQQYTQRKKYVFDDITDGRIALNAADRYAFKEFEMMRKNARWRHSPATESQKDKIREVMIKTLRRVDYLTDDVSNNIHSVTEKLSKGEAGDILTSVTNGGLTPIRKMIEQLLAKKNRETVMYEKTLKKIADGKGMEIKVGHINKGLSL